MKWNVLVNTTRELNIIFNNIFKHLSPSIHIPFELYESLSANPQSKGLVHAQDIQQIYNAENKIL